MSIREIERASIEMFLTDCARAGYFTGSVLDYGSGNGTYRSIVEQAGARYVPFDRMDHPASVALTDVGPDDPLDGFTWDAIVCTQVLQYVPNPRRLLRDIRRALEPGAPLIITGPTNWPCVEKEDLRRWTREGIVDELGAAGFATVEAKYRAYITHDGEKWPLGWQAVARG